MLLFLIGFGLRDNNRFSDAEILPHLTLILFHFIVAVHCLLELLAHRLVHLFKLENILVCVGLDYWLSGDRNSLIYKLKSLWQLWELLRHIISLRVELLLFLSNEHVRNAVLILDLNLVSSLDKAIQIVMFVCSEHVHQLFFVE